MAEDNEYALNEHGTLLFILTAFLLIALAVQLLNQHTILKKHQRHVGNKRVYGRQLVGKGTKKKEYAPKITTRTKESY